MKQPCSLQSGDHHASQRDAAGVCGFRIKEYGNQAAINRLTFQPEEIQVYNVGLRNTGNKQNPGSSVSSRM